MAIHGSNAMNIGNDQLVSQMNQLHVSVLSGYDGIKEAVR